MRYIHDDNFKILSKIALGCDHYGESISEKDALSFLDLYIEKGGNLLDTAHVYGQEYDDGPSTSEQVISKWLKSTGMRNEVVILTKGGHPHIGRMHDSRINGHDLKNDLEASIRQLGTTPDIFLLHRDDKSVPIPEIVDILDSFVSLGLTKTVGVSNWSISRINEARKYAQQNGKADILYSELQYSLAKTDQQTWGDDTIEIMDSTSSISYYENSDITYLTFSSQAKGFFSKVLMGKTDELSDRAKKRFLTKENLARAERVGKLCRKYGTEPAAIALAFILSHEGKAIAIIGASRMEQLENTLKNTNLILSPEDIGFLVSG